MQKRSQFLAVIEKSHAHLSDEELIELIKKNHAERKIDYCMGLIGILRQRKTPLSKQQEQEFIFIAQIYTKMERCLDYFKESTDGWYIDKIDEKNTLSSKIVHRGEALIRYDGQVDIDVSNLMAMIYQTGLFKNWVPFCGESKDVKNVGIAAKVAYCKFNLPFISDREGWFYGQGIDRLTNNGSVVIYVQGITSNKAQQKRLGIEIVRNEKCTEMDVKFMVCEVRMLKPKSYQFRVFAHIDTKVYFIPQFVMGFFSKKFGVYLINKLLVTAADLKGTEWEKKIKQSGDLFYPWMYAKMDFWKEMYGKQIQPDKPPRPPGTEAKKENEQVEKKQITVIKKEIVVEVRAQSPSPDKLGLQNPSLKEANHKPLQKQTGQIVAVKASE